MTNLSQLRIESQDETVINDYRLYEGKLQFHLVQNDGSLLPGLVARGKIWRRRTSLNILRFRQW